MGRQKPKSTLKDDLHEEWKVLAVSQRTKKVELWERTHGTKDETLVYRDMPRPEQLLPPVVDEFMENGLVMQPTEPRPSVEVPNHFYGFSSPETNFIVCLVLDANDARLRRMLQQEHTRAVFREDHYYQLVDDPNLYLRDAASSEAPAFHNKAMLYLTATGIMVYLKCREALQASSSMKGTGVLPRSELAVKARKDRQPKLKQAQAEFDAVLEYEEKKKKETQPLFNVYAYQYATYVHCRDGDILRFQLDYLAIRRHFYDAFPYLMKMDWHPNSPSFIMYRRRYYQYLTPFLDWVDTIRYVIKRCPTVSVSSIYERLINCYSDNFTLHDMLPLGRTMLECFELRKLSKINSQAKHFYGVYVGRKILRNKEPQTHAEYTQAFGEDTVRPVIPHVCSPARRFLVHLYYYDKESMSSMAQVLSVIDLMLRHDFFCIHPLCKLSSIHLEPLIFQIYDFVWMMKKDNVNKGVYLRQQTWDDIKKDNESFAWYQRWDVLNCVSLLFGICQNALVKDLDEVVVDRIVTLIIEVLRTSEYMESVMSYSFFDTYFGLTSTVNCVPNLQSRCVLRVLKKLPLYLVENFKLANLFSMFTPRFWSPLGDARQLEKKNLHDIGEFLVMRNRRMSMKVATEAGGEAISATSAMGAGGAITLFYREFDKMREITVEEEQAMDNDKNDLTRKEEEEKVHVREYKRQETDYRYAQVFTDSFYQATGRPRIFLNETQQYNACKRISEELSKPNS